MSAICCPNCGTNVELARAVGGLTAKQLAVLRFVAEFIVEHDIAPSFEVIMRGVGYRSKAPVHDIIGRLESRGFVSKVPYSARSLTITDRGWAALGVS